MYNRELDLAQTISRDQLNRELGYRGKEAKVTNTDDLARRVAVQRSLRQMPSGSFRDEDSRQKVKTAAAESMMRTGTSEPAATKWAGQASDSEYHRITQSELARNKAAAKDKKLQKTGKKKGPWELGNGDPETTGRYARQANTRNPIDSDTGEARWPLSERSVIFHKNDPIRIFLQNPFTENDEWIYGFTGFVSEYPVTTDYVTGHSTLQIQCYDIKALMQKMRVQMNAILGPFVQPSGLFEDRASIFADLLLPNNWTHAFANMSFENAMALLMTGTTLKREGQGPHFGVGSLAVGKVITYPAKDEKDNKATLEAWHTMCLNGPGKISDEKNIANTVFLTSKDVERIGRGTTTDGPYSPIRAYVHFLLPKAGTAASNLTQTQFDAGTEQRDWVTRYDIVADFCAQLDFEFSVAPNGDVIFEFPMYDFLPEDFGDWKPIFEADYHLISGNMSDESGDIVTAVVVTGGPSNATTQPGLPQAFYMGVIQSSIMASRVGITTENVSKPFVQSNARLRSFGFIEFQKRLANANSFEMEWGFRPFITVNRPILNVVEKRMGLTSSVTETMQVFSTCSTAPAVKYVRQIRPDGTFRFITGGASMPISYRTIFPGTVKSVGNATVGVRTTLEQDGDPGALDNQKSTKQPKNEDRPPPAIKELRPGTYFALTPRARKVADIVAYTLEDRGVLLTNIPMANGTAFSIRARNPEGRRMYSDPERLTLAQKAKDQGYILVDTQQRFIFEVRRPGQPDFVVRPDHG
jgi:hypothetical protein